MFRNKTRTVATVLALSVIFFGLATASAQQAMPALRGQAALDYLKEKGLDDSLAKAVAAARGETRDQAGAGVALTIASTPAQVAELIASDGASFDAFGVSVAIDGDTAIVGANGHTVGGNSSQGAAYVFERNTGGADIWGEVAILTASDGAAGDFFGVSVAIDGDTAVVGAPWKNSDTGAAYVFERNSGGADHWGEVATLTASDAAAGAGYGYSVAIDGDTAVVGASWKNSQQGAAYVFRRNQGGADNWGEVKKLTASDGAAGASFGYSVAIDGDSAVIGAYAQAVGANSQQGEAYVFERNQGGADNWGQSRILTSSDGAAYDSFGYAVSIDGDTAIVGASTKAIGENPSRGAAYVFGRNQGGADNWGQVATLTDSDGAAYDFFGAAVAVDDGTAVVGAYNRVIGSSQGAAFVFGQNQGGADQWGYVEALTGSDGAEGDQFGHSVAIHSGTVVAGALNKTVGGNFGQGAAYIFAGACDEFAQIAERNDPDGAPDDGFGVSVAIDGDTALVGDWGKSTAAADYSGAAYIFARNAGATDGWGQIKILTASDAVADDALGISVAIDGDVAVVGAEGWSGDSGAAYVFERNSGGLDNWGEVAILTASDGAPGDYFGYSVAIDGDSIVVGTPLKNSLEGAAYVFQRNLGGADAWGQVAKLTASDGASEDELGYSVAIDRDTVVVAAPYKNSRTGAVYVFARNSGGADNWGEVRQLTASEGGSFGNSVAIDGDTAVVGSPDTNDFAGAAYVFERNAGGAESWGQVKMLTGAGGGQFGYSVAIDGDTAAVGAIVGNSDEGTVFVLERNAGGADNWGEVKKLTASDGATGDEFGWSVAIDGGTVVAGARGRSDLRGAAYFFGCGDSAAVSPRALKEGVLAELQAIRATVTDRGDRGKLDDAIKHLTKSLNPTNWIDDSHVKKGRPGETVFNEEKPAVDRLKELIRRNRSGLTSEQLQPLIDDLFAADRGLAETAIDDAIAASGKPADILHAQVELARGDASASAGRTDAIDHYKNAWRAVTH